MVQPLRLSTAVQTLLFAVAVAILGPWVAPAAGQVIRVYVQDSPQAVDLLAHANDRLERDEPEEAVKLIQQVIDEHGSKLLERSKGRFAEARRVASLMVAGSPRLLAAYQQLYDAPAEQLVKAAANDPAMLGEVIDRYAMTTAGLEAGLRLAGLYLEAGRPEAAGVALERLADHPSLNGVRPLWLELSATAALLGGSKERFETMLWRLSDGGQAETAARLEAIARTIQRPEPIAALSPLDPLPPASPPDAVARPLWTVSIGGAEQWMLQMQRDRTQLDNIAADGQLLNAMPVVFGRRLYVNSGATVYAIEPASGRELWRRDIDESLAAGGDPQLRNVIGGLLPRGVDLSGIAVDEQRVIAIAGINSILAAFSPYYGSLGQSSLVSLDAKTGAVQWSRNPGEGEQDMANSAWYGRPVIWQGRVYCTIRKRARSSYQDAYLACLDAETGRVLWKRHLGSTPMSDRGSSAGLSHVTIDGGWAYVDSGLGTMSKLAASDGMIQWMTTREISDRPRGLTSSRPWAVSAPIIVEAGVVVFDEWENAIRVFDSANGQQVDKIDANRWDGPLYLAKIGSDVLAVGVTTGRFDGKTLENKWRFKSGSTVRGRAAVTDRLLYLPTDNFVLLVDAKTGRELDKREIELPATLLALDGQLIAAQRHRLSAFTSWDVAMRRLNEQIERNPLDHRPVMSLAWLAYGHDRPEALLDALDRAIAMVKAAPKPAENAAELFDQILTMSTDTDRQDFGLRGKLFDRLATLAEGPDQEVTYRLAYGRYLESKERFREAVEQYQALLAEPMYRDQQYRHDSGSRQAGLEAQQRLRTLVEEHGRDIYASFDQFARRRLKELAAENDPAPLEELAEAYPVSTAAVDALRVAAERAVGLDQGPRAVAILNRAAQITANPTERAFIVGRQAELLADAGQPRQAARVIRRLLMAHPKAQPARGGQPTDAAAWLDELDTAARSHSDQARINPPITGAGRSVAARLLTDPIDGPRPEDTWLLVASAQLLEARRASDLAVLWTRPINPDSVEVIAVNSKRVFLFDHDRRTVQALDATDGKPLWTDARIGERLDSIPMPELPRDPDDPRWQIEQQRLLGGRQRIFVRGNMVVVNGRIIRGAQFAEPEQPEVTPVLLAAGDDTVVVADARGRVVSLDAERGDVRWQAATLLRRADILRVFGDHLVVAGQDEDGSPLLAVYDARSGTLLHRIAKPKLQPFRWVALTPMGRLVYVGDSQVGSFDPVRGQTTWTAEPGARIRDDAPAWLGAERIVIRTEDDDLVVINVETGQITGRLPIRGVIEGPMQVRQDAGDWFVTGDARCIAIDPDGRPLWNAALADAVTIADSLITERYIVLLAEPVRLANTPIAAHTRRIYILDRRTGSIRFQTDIAAASPVNNLAAVAGRLLLSGDAFTAVLDGSP